MEFFVYGTLTDPERVGDVVESYVFLGGAVLDGLHAVEGRYPTLAPGGSVAGRVLRTDEVEALDAYEGVDGGLYVRVAVPWADGPPKGATGDRVALYVGDPDRLEVPEGATWPGEGSLRERVRRYLDRNQVAVRPTES